MRGLLFWTFIYTLVVLGCAAVLFSTIAQSHDWYTGKRDPVTGGSCCGGYDCGPIKKVEVSPVIGGWLVEATGEVIAYSRTMISEDDKFHRCVFLHGERKGETRCLFAPPMGF